MPFQSEKQRRFLHANHPEIAQRWERDYANGGILDLNESEEIISDDGNDIELTDYNAAFDDPNDLSTGVRTLFMKKGGNVRLGPHTATDLLAKKNPDGTRSKYQPPGEFGGPGYAGSRSPDTNRERAITQQYSAPAAPKSSPVGDYRGQHDWKVVTKPGTGIEVVDTGPEKEEPYVIVGGRKLHKSKWGVPGLDPREKYDTEEEMLTGIYGINKKGIEQKNLYKTGRTRTALELAKREQLAQLKKMGLGKLGTLGVMLVSLLAMGVPFMDALKALPKTISVNKKDMQSLLKSSYPVMKAKKAHIAALTTMKEDLLTDVDITNPNEMVNLEETTDFTKTMNELGELTKIRDDEDPGDKGPELPPQLGGTSTEEMATEYIEPTDWLGGIRERQAQKKAYDEKIESERPEEDNPIVSGTGTNIIALGNSGGLANLFRVKNQ